MDADRFDRLSKTLSTTGSRRALLHLLSALPLAGALAALLGEESAGKGRRKRRKSRHGQKQNQRQQRRRHDEQRREQQRKERQNRHKKRKPPTPEPGCHPAAKAQTCTGKCASVTDNCGLLVDCGPCTCATGCHPVCQTCNSATGVCDPIANGASCDDGNACTTGETCSNGTCGGGTTVRCAADVCQIAGTCDPVTGCPTPTNQADGTCCDGATGVCAGGVCAACATGQVCEANACCTTAGNAAPSAALCCDGLTKCADSICRANCPAVVITAGPPTMAHFTVRDADGLVSIVVTESDNADTVVRPFIEGTTEPVTLTSTKIDQTQPATVAFQVTDGLGTITPCGAVF
jgi:hypothetical protein